tara:strand:- start:3361 stop:3549 length:189 start_codon:yes stop_codon:yes gene_type:complete
MATKKIKKVKPKAKVNPHPVGTEAHAAWEKRQKNQIKDLQANLDKMSTPEGRLAALKEKNRT